MATYPLAPAVQISQTRFREQLVNGWGIPEGARVLEIGCGQGDTTAVLADAVGPSGKVLAVDFADEEYGAPISLGDATRHLSEGPLGSHIEFRLSFDLFGQNFAPNSFDVVVLAHSTWYFDSLERLRETLFYVRSWAPRLCLSEWDLEPRSIEEVGHFLAVLIQGQLEAFKTSSEANVRTPYSRETLRRILAEAHWESESETVIDADLDDGRWEVSAALADSLRESQTLNLPTKLQDLVRSQIDILRRLSLEGKKRSLPAYSIVAKRA